MLVFEELSFLHALSCTILNRSATLRRVVALANVVLQSNKARMDLTEAEKAQLSSSAIRAQQTRAKERVHLLRNEADTAERAANEAQQAAERAANEAQQAAARAAAAEHKAEDLENQAELMAHHAALTALKAELETSK